MKYYPHPQRSALRNYFPLANALFSYALAPGALMIYAYLSYLQHAGASSRDATCRSVSRALGMSENTVRKHLRGLERHRLARIDGGVCIPLGWMRRENAKRFFPLPMEIFCFGLSPGAFAVYAYLLSRENRKTFDCVVSANKIAKVTCMSRNTVRKCVSELEEQMLISTERTSVITKKQLKYNGALRYRIAPVQTALDYRHERQLAELDLARERARVRKQLEKQQAASARQVHPVVSHKVDGLENCRFETRFEVKTTASERGSSPCSMAGRGKIPPRSTGSQTPLWKPLLEAKTAYERAGPGKRFRRVFRPCEGTKQDSRRSPAQRVRWEKETQRNERFFALLGGNERCEACGDAKQDKGALSRAENICPQCGQGAGTWVLSVSDVFSERAICNPANAVDIRICGTSQDKNGGIMSKKTDDRKLIQFRAQLETVRRIEQWYAVDGCKSRNEFIERAVNYYVDALALMDNALLPRAVMVAIDGRLSQFEDRFARLAYKTAVELDMQNGLLADAFNVPEDDMRRRRAESVRNVKHTNGRISLEQRMRDSDVELADEGDDEWRG